MSISSTHETFQYCVTYKFINHTLKGNLIEKIPCFRLKIQLKKLFCPKKFNLCFKPKYVKEIKELKLLKFVHSCT